MRRVGNALTRRKGVGVFGSALLRRGGVRGFGFGIGCSGVIQMTRDGRRQVGIGRIGVGSVTVVTGRLCGKVDYDRGECPYIHRSLAEDLSQLNKGADGACGEDTRRLKSAVVGWLMSGQPTPEPALEPQCKFGCGFYHDAMAWLL